MHGTHVMHAGFSFGTRMCIYILCYLYCINSVLIPYLGSLLPDVNPYILAKHYWSIIVAKYYRSLVYGKQRIYKSFKSKQKTTGIFAFNIKPTQVYIRNEDNFDAYTPLYTENQYV